MTDHKTDGTHTAEAKSLQPNSNGQPMIEADRLSKFYGIFAATREVSFKVYRGEVVAFLGPNGAGKSTTMKILTGYLSPSEGVARIAGYDMSLDRLRGSRLLGYLPETGPLYPDMTPFTLLTFFAEARGMNKSQTRNRIEAVVEICALEQRDSQTDQQTVQGLSSAHGHGPSPVA